MNEANLSKYLNRGFNFINRKRKKARNGKRELQTEYIYVACSLSNRQ